MKFRRLALLLLLVVGVSSARAQDPEQAPLHLSKPPVRTEIVKAVRTQLEAFQAGDWEAAYACAARSFQAAMPLRQFVTMIGTHYVTIWKNTRAEFGIPSDNGAIAVVPVRVFGPGDKSEAYNWLLVQEGGGWKVTGVVPQPVNGA